jgi:hypothetical protein
MPIHTLQRRIKGLVDQGELEFKGGPRTGGYHAEDWEVAEYVAE